jgi:hypothetical protein
MTKRKRSTSQSSTAAPAANAGPSTSVASLQASMAALGTGPVTATAPCPNATMPPKKKKKIAFAVVKDSNQQVVAGQQDRRHVLGYDDSIRPIFEQAVNEYLQMDGGEDKLKAKLFELNNAAVPKLSRVPKLTAPLDAHLKYSLTQLNSAVGNLNPEAAHENQAIEHVRQQAQGARRRLEKAFAEDLPDLNETKKILLDVFAAQTPSNNTAGALITGHGNSVREVVRDRINKATTDKELIDILTETETSTGIDLSKRPGAKKQTEFSLNLANDLQLASQRGSTVPPARKLETLYTILKTPKETA